MLISAHRFLLPALQINNILGQTNVDEVREALEKLPTGLADNLSMTIERIKKQHNHHSRSRLAFLVLKWLSTVRRPITTTELQYAIAAQPGVGKLSALTNPKFFVESCFGLTIIDKETSVVRLVHFSVKEFLELKRDELFDDPESALAGSCLAYMTLCLKSYLKLESVKRESTDLSDWPFWNYAAGQWGLHARMSCTGPAETAMIDFAFSEPLLHTWARYVRSIDNMQSDDIHYITHGAEWENCASRVGPTPSPLHVAAVYGLVGLAQEYLSRGLEANPLDGSSATPLMVASAAPVTSFKVLDLLLTVAENLDLNTVDNEGRSALHYAAKAGDLSVFCRLLDQPTMDVNAGRALEGTATSASHITFESLLAHPKFSLRKLDHQSIIRSVSSLARALERPECVSVLTSRSDFRIYGHPLEEAELHDTWQYLLNTDYDYISFGEETMPGVKGLPAMILVLDKIFSDQLDSPDAMKVLFPFVYYAYAGFYRPQSAISEESSAWSDTDSSGDMDEGAAVNCLAGEMADALATDGLGWPSKKAVAALSTEGYIPSTMAPGGEKNPTLYGIGFWDDPFETQRGLLRERLQTEGISFFTVDSKGRGFIHTACLQTEGWDTALTFLLRIGTDPNLRDNAGKTPLHYAVSCGNKEAIQLLLAAGADIRASDKNGCTVLHSAASGSSLDVIADLIDRGADVHARKISLETVLHSAAMGITNEARVRIEYLVEKGCRLDARDKDGFTAGFDSVYGGAEAVQTCLGLGQSPVTYDGPLGTSMLLHCVFSMLYEEGTRCLASLGAPRPSISLTRSPSPFSPQYLLNRVGCFGMNALDYLDQFDRSVALNFGFTEQNWTSHIPTPPAIRRKHLLHFFLHRVSQMLEVTEDIEDLRNLTERAAHQLILLGDEDSAVNILELCVVPESRELNAPFFFRDRLHCSSCQKREGPLFKCRVCAFVLFCTACRELSPHTSGYNDARQCEGHSFIRVPGRGWETRRDGTVNDRGQTLIDFLEDLKIRYELELLAIDGV